MSIVFALLFAFCRSRLFLFFSWIFAVAVLLSCVASTSRFDLAFTGAAFAIGRGPEAVVAGDEVVGDGEQVVCELLLRVWAVAVVTLTEYHDLDASLLKDPLHELEGKAAEAVAVGNHNCRDLAAVDEVQKPLEAWAVPVEA